MLKARLERSIAAVCLIAALGFRLHAQTNDAAVAEPTTSTAVVQTNEPAAATSSPTNELNSTESTIAPTNAAPAGKIPAAAPAAAAATPAAPAKAPPAEPASSAAPAKSSVEKESRPDYWPISISAEGGTMGAGGAVSLRFLDHLGVRGGGDYLRFDYDQTFEDIHYIGQVRLQSESAALDYYPGKKSSFRISVGAIFNQNQFNGSPDQDFTIGGITFTPAEYGQINLRIKQQPINPYVAIGGNFLTFGHKHHWALGGELGVLYSKWDVTLTQSGGILPPPPALIDNQRKLINDNLNKYPVWPILKLQLTCSF